MSFTDEDLARLRTMVLNCEAFYGMNQPPIPLRLSALLARLEAAEKAARWFNSLKVDDENSEPYKDYLAWRKSCGS